MTEITQGRAIILFFSPSPILKNIKGMQEYEKGRINP